jgi:hypothetical protein
MDDEKNVHIIYLGDHDPSGIDMSRDVNDRAQLFASAEDFGWQHVQLQLHRVALNMPQIEELRPPENPAKLTDSRASDYIRRFGRSSWELDAIEPARLAALVRGAILELRDDDIYQKVSLEEEMMRKQFKLIADKILKPRKDK